MVVQPEQEDSLAHAVDVAAQGVWVDRQGACVLVGAGQGLELFRCHLRQHQRLCVNQIILL